MSANLEIKLIFVLMFLKKIGLFNFKSYSELTLDLGKGLNILVGLNGSGKTNVLESIYFTCLTKSFSGMTDAQLVKEGEQLFVVHLDIDDQRVSSTYKLGSKKQVLVDKKPYKRVSDHIGKFPVVFVSPNDHDYIRDSSETRRKFFDELFCQTSATYLEHLLQYTKLLKQRNSLLKQFRENNYFDGELLSVYDERLEPHNTWIHNYRVKGTKEMSVYSSMFYAKISDESERISLKYMNDRSSGLFAEETQKLRERDRQSGRTNFGIHKDDYDFEIEERPVKKYGSQGQQKSFMLSLQLAKYKYLNDNTGISPFLLLDDVFDKLDQKRILKLLEVIENGIVGQCFITDASKERSLKFVEGLVEKPTIFEVVDGEVFKI